MESSSLVDDLCSPESTVTSLLSSSGYLKSSLVAPEHNTTFRYRDKTYESASAALEAYIADFDSSHQKDKTLQGKPVLLQNQNSTPSTPRVRTLRNKDVLREHLTDRELGYLNLPVSSLHHGVNQDRLSMTTDELLSIPYDGSMPVTHTSAFIQGLFSQSGASLPCPPYSSGPAHKTLNSVSNLHSFPQPSQQHPHPTTGIRICRNRERPRAATLKLENDISSDRCYRSPHKALRSVWEKPSFSLHDPHWLTSNKTHMDSSEISVPDMKYPVWIRRCELSEPLSSPESDVRDAHVSRPQAPSWVAELEDDYDDNPELMPSQVANQKTLRDLRLQFAEQISLLAAEKNNSKIMETLYRDNKIESLIQKANQVLTSLSSSCGTAGGHTDQPETRTQHHTQEAVVPPNTKSLPTPSQCQHDTLEPAALGVTAALTGRGVQARTLCGHHGNDVLKQPGPAEALKQLLFKLQAVEAGLQCQQQVLEASTVLSSLQEAEAPQRSEAELENLPKGPSLHRALHHLSHLKALVEECGEKHSQKYEEKDEDEGRYSSSSTDGVTCSQQKSS